MLWNNANFESLPKKNFVHFEPWGNDGLKWLGRGWVYCGGCENGTRMRMKIVPCGTPEREVTVNSLAPGRCGSNFKLFIFKLISMIDFLSISYNIAISCIAQDWWLVNNDSGNSLVPSGNKSLHEPMLTQIYVTIWHLYCDNMWCQRFGSILVQVLTWCCQATSQFPNLTDDKSALV